MANDNRKVKSASQSLNTVIRDLDNYSLAKGDLSGINSTTIHNYSHNFNPTLELKDISSTNHDVTFNYQNVSTRVCNDFVGKMLSSDNNISVKVNNNLISNNLNEIAGACIDNDEINDVAIIYKRPVNSSTMSVITASVNTPPPPAIDAPVPFLPTPSPIPTVPAFIPPTSTPVIYSITGAAPVYPVTPPSGGPITVVGGGGNGNVTPPTWTPPGYTPAPPATGTPVDEIDQDVLPPIITTETRTTSCPTGYTGNITETRKKTYYQGSGNTTYSAWTQTSNTCVVIPPPPAELDFTKNYIHYYSYSASTPGNYEEDLQYIINGQTVLFLDEWDGLNYNGQFDELSFYRANPQAGSDGNSYIIGDQFTREETLKLMYGDNVPAFAQTFYCWGAGYTCNGDMYFKIKKVN